MYLGFGYYHICPTINQGLTRTSRRSIEKQAVWVLVIRAVVREEEEVVVGIPIHLRTEGTLEFQVFLIFVAVMI